MSKKSKTNQVLKIWLEESKLPNTVFVNFIKIPERTFYNYISDTHKSEIPFSELERIGEILSKNAVYYLVNIDSKTNKKK